MKGRLGRGMRTYLGSEYKIPVAVSINNVLTVYFALDNRAPHPRGFCRHRTASPLRYPLATARHRCRALTPIVWVQKRQHTHRSEMETNIQMSVRFLSLLTSCVLKRRFHIVQRGMRFDYGWWSLDAYDDRPVSDILTR
jgi:hypothetical protein